MTMTMDSRRLLQQQRVAAATTLCYQRVNDALLPRKLSYLFFFCLLSVLNRTVTVKTILWRARVLINLVRTCPVGRKRRKKLWHKNGHDAAYNITSRRLEEWFSFCFVILSPNIIDINFQAVFGRFFFSDKRNPRRRRSRIFESRDRIYCIKKMYKRAAHILLLLYYIVIETRLIFFSFKWATAYMYTTTTYVWCTYTYILGKPRVILLYSRRHRRRRLTNGAAVLGQPTGRPTHLARARLCVCMSFLSGIYERARADKVKRSKRVRGAIMRGAVLTHKTMRATRNVSLLWPKTRCSFLDDSIILVLYLHYFSSSYTHARTLNIYNINTYGINIIYAKRVMATVIRERKKIRCYFIFYFYFAGELIKNLSSNWAALAFSGARRSRIYNV